MKVHTCGVALLLTALLGSSASAATIKLKSGESRTGELSRRVVLKGSVEESSDTRFKYTLTYMILDGRTVTTVDERGVNTTSGAKVGLVVYGYPSETPLDDATILGISSKFVDIGFETSMNIEGGVIAVSAREAKNLTDPLLGEIRVESDTVKVVPALTLRTESGEVELPVSDIIPPKSKTTQ